MVVEYKPVEWGKDYDIVHDPRSSNVCGWRADGKSLDFQIKNG